MKDIIIKDEFKKNNDYLIRNIPEQHPSGTKYKNEYYFHPDAFGIILMRSKNQKKYSKYLSKYQIELKQSEVSKLIDKLDASDKRNALLEIKLEEQTEELKTTRLELQQSNKIFLRLNHKMLNY